MEKHDEVRQYTGRDIAVSYDARRCIHAAECLRGLPRVFDTARRPWILPDGAVPAEVAEVIERCPSGALHYVRLDGGLAERPADPTTITPVRDGPLYVRGALQLRATNGTRQITETRMALCRCGASGNKPFCDNSHRRIHFDDGSETAPSEHIHEESRA